MDKEQLISVLSELEPFQTHQPRQRSEKPLPRSIGPPHPARPGFSGDSWNQEKGKKHVTLSVPSSTSENMSHDRGRNQKSTVSTPENRSTASDSNSHSEDSNDEVSGNNGRRKNEKNELEVQSKKEGDGSRQSHGDGTEVDPSLDPKKAKR